MIVGAQIRAGRAALNWSIDELAKDLELAHAP